MDSFRKLIFWLHLACGISVGLVVFTMSLTGVILTYEKQMIRWADGFHVSPPSPQAERLGLSALFTRVHEATGTRPSIVQIEAAREGPVKMRVGRMTIGVDPYTGESLGEGAVGVRRFFQQMIAWHRWLGQDGEGRAVGKAITGACNLAFLFILCSGAYLWWPRRWIWRHLRPIVFFRRGLPPKARNFNWHNVFGVWCVLPLLVVVATATFFSYRWTSNMLYSLTGEERAAGRATSPEEGPGPTQPLDPGILDSLFEQASILEPGWRVATIRIPVLEHLPVSFTMDRGNGTRPDLKSTVVLDGASGSLIEHRTYASLGRAETARNWIRWLHTGEAGGWVGQTLAGIVSLGACFLVYTGWMLSWRRLRAWAERRKNP